MWTWSENKDKINSGKLHLIWCMFLLCGADILHSQISSGNGRSISLPSQFLSLIVNILVTKGDALRHSSVLLDVRCVPFIRP